MEYDRNDNYNRNERYNEHINNKPNKQTGISLPRPDPEQVYNHNGYYEDYNEDVNQNHNNSYSSNNYPNVDQMSGNYLQADAYAKNQGKGQYRPTSKYSQNSQGSIPVEYGHDNLPKGRLVHQRKPSGQSNHNLRNSQFVELSNLPLNVSSASFNRAHTPESQSSGNHHRYNSDGENKKLVAGYADDAQEYGEFDPPVTNRPLSNFYNDRYANLQSQLPNHVKAANIIHQGQSNHSEPRTYNPAATSPQYPPGGTPLHQSNFEKKPRERSCFGCCFCTGKMCVVFTTAFLFVLGVILFFLWVRIPGFAASTELGLKAGPNYFNNDTYHSVKMDLVYKVRLINNNFYPLYMNRLNATVIDNNGYNKIGVAEAKNVYVGPLGETFFDLVLNIQYATGYEQDKEWQNIKAACPDNSVQVGRVPLSLIINTEGYFSLFSWANIIPKESMRRNFNCP